MIDLRGRERIEHWKSLALAGDWDTLVGLLLNEHYDPAYQRSLGSNYPQAEQGPLLRLTSAEPAAMQALVNETIAVTGSAMAPMRAPVWMP